MEKSLSIILWIAVALSGLTILVIVVATAMNMNEIGECTRWARDAERYPEYYLTHWQKAQC
ncbi:MAG: hypothetical protein KGL39_48955, partial [Patescibacteria group bacterium]|nr:hypothetical protein [Patescibacteria group bacterium]